MAAKYKTHGKMSHKYCALYCILGVAALVLIAAAAVFGLPKIVDGFAASTAVGSACSVQAPCTAPLSCVNQKCAASS